MYREAILKTIAYFDVFEYPVTLIELHNFLLDSKSVTLYYLSINLAELVKNGVIAQSEGFYFFPGKENNVVVRKERFNFAEQKYKIALRGIKYVKHVPFLKFVAVCNNLSNNNVTKDSDIDLFIVAKKNRLYFVRFFVTLILSIAKLRRHDNKIKNRFCLSFYVTENNLDLSKIKIIDNDFYLMFWIANLYPIYNESFIEEIFVNNNWILEELANVQQKLPSQRRIVIYNNLYNKFLTKIFENRFGDMIEVATKNIQLNKMHKNTHSLQLKNDSRVIISNDMLKFHENDRREYYYNLYINNLTAMKNQYAEN